MIHRKMVNKIFTGILFWAILSAMAFAQGPPEKRDQDFPGRRGPGFPGPMMGPMPRPMEDLAGRLHLTDDQVVRLQEIRESYLRDTLIWRNELVVKRFDLRDMFRNPQADPSQILAKQREISELESKTQERAVLYQLEMRKILTPEQIKLLPPGFGLGEFRGPHMMRGRGWGMGRE